MSTPDTPAMLPARSATADWTVLPSWLPVPGMGLLAVNSFLLNGPEPMLVDTGLACLGDDWLNTLAGEVSPADLRWIWISHADPDHVGNLARLIEAAPQATVLTTFLGQAKMMLAGLQIPRVELIEPGREIEIGHRRLIPVQPPYYDAPETMGFRDISGDVCFAADCFGALLPTLAETACAVPEADLDAGLAAWSAIDAPWLAAVDRARFAETLSDFTAGAGSALLSAHLPPVIGDVGRLGTTLAATWCDAARDGKSGALAA